MSELTGLTSKIQGKVPNYEPRDPSCTTDPTIQSWRSRRRCAHFNSSQSSQCSLTLNFLKNFGLHWFGKLTSQNRYSTDVCLPSIAAGMGYERRPLKLVCFPPSIPGVYISLYASIFLSIKYVIGYLRGITCFTYFFILVEGVSHKNRNPASFCGRGRIQHDSSQDLICYL